MIEKMQMVYVVSSVSRKDEMLEGLRNLGLLHLAEKKSPARAATKDLQHFQDGDGMWIMHLIRNQRTKQCTCSFRQRI